MPRINFIVKLLIPVIMFSTMVGIFAYNMKDISSLVDSSLKSANQEELKIKKDAKFIQDRLETMKASLIEDILNKKYNDKNLIELKNNFLKVKTTLHGLEKSPYFQTEDRIEILKNLNARVNGYYSILREMPLDFQDSYEDGAYSMVSLIHISKKLDIELLNLQQATKEILNQKVFKIVSKKVEFYIMMLVLSLVVLFLTTLFIDKKLIRSIGKLRTLNQAFLLFVQQKSDRVEKIDYKDIPNDEIGDVIKDVSDTVVYVQDIIKEDRELKKEIVDTQREIIFTMGAIGESRSKETGNHVKRVAEYSYLLAKLHGLDESEAELIKESSPMHDIGKVAIPDEILKKPGKLTHEEFEIMKNHSQIGYDMLKHSNRPILKAASIIAYEHHEKYNGKGYPKGLKGDEIHIYGSITAIADVFDALGSDRVYKKAWSDEKIINLFIEETGEHFHPELANLFLANFEKFTQIREKFKDVYIEDEEKVLA